MELANHGLILLQQLNAQREFGFLCDCTIAIGDVFFKAHKAVLAAFSNYFRMLFIHQDSDCVRLKAADIQPDIFSYLLNLMYTGKLAPQLIDPARLEQGVKFLHAYPLLQEASLASQTAFSHPEPSLPLSTSLFGIQISDKQVTLSGRLPVRRQLSSPFDLDSFPDRKYPSTSAVAAAFTNHASKLDSSFQEMVEASTSGQRASYEEHGGNTPTGEAPSSGSSNTILHVKPSIMKRNASFRKHYSCHLCGSRFNQRSLLREHLLQHSLARLPLVAKPSGAHSPVLPGGGAATTPEVEEVLLRGSGERSAAMTVEMLSDSEQAPPSGFSMDSPRAELSGWATGCQSQADTPPPSDIADIDNLESADLDREVKRRKYECATCGRKFIQKSHWREHMYIHTGKPYKCSACGKSFCRANQAARHVCLTQGADAYTMVDRQSMELCAAGDDTSQMEALFLGSARPYKCNVCETTFSSPNEVIKHLCFSQGALAGLQGQSGVRLLHGEEFPKDEGSDSSGAATLITAIKTEQILVE
ncbi:zinc finger and BTB domain-containing protein 2b [Salmo salar]|uniref:Zinc finger and BTB domain-containing protein 2b n=1 Tax=Salmo salar TaxID=8030 RepID=A0A1S3S9S7_SALSA|nr:zinc finger and BTB domain-containing protein 2b [Salmo salar]|eukprot:XP_014061099.1 PREDICTED: zinc finger and BTB domain-containing protein 2 [Salmo salar]